jgi:hypothetical protein
MPLIPKASTKYTITSTAARVINPSIMNKSLEPVFFLLYAKTATTLRKTHIDRPVKGAE